MITNQQLAIARIQAGSLETLSLAIRDIIAAAAVDRAKALRMWAYYDGQHDILKRTVTDTTKPNNRLVNDFPGEIVDTTVGYFIGVPVSYASEEQTYLDAVNEVRRLNSEELHNERIVREMCVTGRAYELLYIDEEARIRWMRIPATEMAVVADGSRQDVIAYALRYYPVTVDGKAVTKCELYDTAQVTYYLLDGDALTLDSTEPQNPRPHQFGQVPVVEYLNGDRALGEFEKVVTLIDDFDRRTSDNSNELEAFRNAYLYLKGMMGTEAADLQLAKENGAFLLPPDGEAGFLTKSAQDGATEHHLDRLDGNIHRFSQTPCLTDESFGGNLSGVAIRYKLFGLETKAVSRERCMTAGLRRRWELVTALLNLKGGAYDPAGLRWEFRRNLPPNLSDEADVAGKLKGIVSEETILGLLSFIDDPAAELERLKVEREANIAAYGFGQTADTGSDEADDQGAADGE